MTILIIILVVILCIAGIIFPPFLFILWIISVVLLINSTNELGNRACEEIKKLPEPNQTLEKIRLIKDKGFDCK